MNTNATTNNVTPSTPNPKQPQQRQTAKEIIAANVKELIAQLEAGHSNALTAYLDAMSRFHNYSFGNVLEIARQMPDATRVAGLYAWNQLGRKVKKGEKGSDRKARVFRLQSKHQLFPQVYSVVDEYVRTKVNFQDENPSELGLGIYVQRIIERLLARIEPNDESGEMPLMPILNRYKPIGSTAEVEFKTTKPCFATAMSHINQVVADTQQWEQAAAFRLEMAVKHGDVLYYAKNDHLGLMIPYEYLGVEHNYLPDYLVRMANGVTLLLEIKGQEDNQAKAKHDSGHRWISAVNNWGKLGKWALHICRNPQMLEKELAYLFKKSEQ
jgi:N-terminal domain of anti-restriction factor ArdC